MQTRPALDLADSYPIYLGETCLHFNLPRPLKLFLQKMKSVVINGFIKKFLVS